MLVIIYSKLLILDVRQKDTKSYRPPLLETTQHLEALEAGTARISGALHNKTDVKFPNTLRRNTHGHHFSTKLYAAISHHLALLRPRPDSSDRAAAGPLAAPCPHAGRVGAHFPPSSALVLRTTPPESHVEYGAPLIYAWLTPERTARRGGSVFP